MGVVKGVGSKTEKQKKKVVRRDAKRAPRLCQSQIGVLSSRWWQNGDGEALTAGCDGAVPRPVLQ